MIENPSEYKIRRSISLIFGVRVTVATLILVLVSVMTSCKKNTQPISDCPTPEQTLTDYSSFLNTITTMKDVQTAELIDCVKRWKDIDDSVTTSLKIASQYNDNDSLPERYFQIRNSIGKLLINMIDSKQRDFKDYLQVARALNYSKLDTTKIFSFREMRQFFKDLDRRPVYNSSARENITFYENLLNKTLSQGFSSHKDIFHFFIDEDRAFRTFLCYLPEMGKIPLSSIRDSTKKVLSNIIALSYDDSFPMDSKEILVLLTMRNNRRLIQNANQCIIDIENKKISSGDQITAYLWMLLQPWVSFDSFAYALLDESQWDEMEELADNTPKAIERLKGAEFPVEPTLLPNILIKSFITQLM